MASVTWNGASADWGVTSDWSTNAIPGAADDVVFDAGTFTVSIAAGESFDANSLNMSGGTVDIAGTLNFTNASGGSFSVGPLTVEAGGVVSGEGILFGPGPILNQGVMEGDVNVATGGQPLFVTPTSTFTNQGLMLATAGGNVDIDANNSGTFANLASGTLTGGTYEADTTSTLAFVTPGTAPAFNVLDATLTFNGFGSAIDSVPSGSSAFSSVEGEVNTIGAGGVVNVLGGRDYGAGFPITDDGSINLGGGTFDAPLSVSAGGSLQGFGTIAQTIANGGIVEARGGFLTLASGVTDAGTLIVDGNATMVLNGSFTQPITDDGTMQAQNGTLALTGTIGGGGGFVIEGGSSSSFTTLAIGSGADKPVAFNGQFGDLLVEAPASFNATVTGFGSTDVIDLAGVTADAATVVGGNLVVTSGGATVDQLALTGNYGGAPFATHADGFGGTNITVSGVDPRDYAFEGPYWQSKTITWSFAASNLAGDSSAAFSNFFDPGTQSAEVNVVNLALTRWASVAGFNFVQVADSASVDIRIGWGDLLNAGLGEIGQASFKFEGDVMNPDGIVRLEDPAETALVANGGVIGGLQYSGESSTMYQVALHEIGHALGLAHSTDPNAVMFPTAQGVTNQDADASDIAGMQALYAAVACYAAGASILTARGEVAVEDLCVGDLVPGLMSGRLRRVRWIGWRDVDAAAPIRVCAGAIGQGRPHRDLMLSPDHAVLMDDALVPVRYLVNGVSVAQERADAATYFHVELEDAGGAAVHDVLLAQGLAAESYLDSGNRGLFGDDVELPRPVRRSASP